MSRSVSPGSRPYQRLAWPTISIGNAQITCTPPVTTQLSTQLGGGMTTQAGRSTITTLAGGAGQAGTKIIKSSYLVQSTKSAVEAEPNVDKADADNAATSDACNVASKSDGKTPDNVAKSDANGAAKVPATIDNPVNSDVQRNTSSESAQRSVRSAANVVSASKSGSSSSATAGPHEVDATDDNAADGATKAEKKKSVLNLSKPLGLVSTPGITLRGGSLRVDSSDNLHGNRARSVELVKPKIHVSGFGTGIPFSGFGQQKPELSVPPLRDLSITAGAKIRDVSTDGISGTSLGNSYIGLGYQSSAGGYQPREYQPSSGGHQTPGGHHTPAGYQSSAGVYRGSSDYRSSNSSYQPRSDMSDIRAIAATGRSDGRLLESVRADHFSRRKKWQTAQQEAFAIAQQHQNRNHNESNSIVGKIMKQLNSTEQILRSVRDPPKQELHLSSQRKRAEKQYGGEFNPFLPGNAGQAPGRPLNLAEIAQGISYIQPGNLGAPPQLGQPLTATPLGPPSMSINPVNLPSTNLPSASLQSTSHPVAAPLLNPSAIATPVSYNATPVNPAEMVGTASLSSTSFHGANGAKIMHGSNSNVIHNLTGSSSSSTNSSKQKTTSHVKNEQPQSELQVGQQNGTNDYVKKVHVKSAHKHVKSQEPSVVEQRKDFPKMEQPMKHKTLPQSTGISSVGQSSVGIRPLTVPSLIKIRSEEAEVQPESAVDTEVGLEQSVEHIKKSPDSNTHIEPTLKATLKQESSRNESCLAKNENCLAKDDTPLTTNGCSMPNIDACTAQNGGNVSDKLCVAHLGAEGPSSKDNKTVDTNLLNKSEPEGTSSALLAEIDLLRGQLLDEQQLRSVAESRLRLIEQGFRDREHQFLQREQAFEEREQQFSESEQQFNAREREFQRKLEAKETELQDKEACIKSLMKVFGRGAPGSGEIPKKYATTELPMPAQHNSSADNRQRNSSCSADSVDDNAPLELPVKSEFGSKDSLEPYNTAYTAHEQKPTKENQNSYQKRTITNASTLAGYPNIAAMPLNSNTNQKRTGIERRDATNQNRRDGADEGHEQDGSKVKRSNDPDAEIQRYVRLHPDFPYAIEKIGNGQYVFGREKKEVYKRGNKFFVEVGGGSEQLHEYMENLHRKGMRVEAHWK